MTYGYRLNVEDVFLKHADECWQRAKNSMVEIEDAVPETGARFFFLGPDCEQCISDSIFAVTGWAICLESYVNLAWNTDEKTRHEFGKFREKNTLEKLKYILKGNAIDLSDKNWLADIKQLFKQRNDLVHFKKIIEYVGFGFAPEYQKNLSQENLKKYRNALEQAIKILSETVGLESRLLESDFELFYYDE